MDFRAFKKSILKKSLKWLYISHFMADFNILWRENGWGGIRSSLRFWWPLDVRGSCKIQKGHFFHESWIWILQNKSSGYFRIFLSFKRLLKWQHGTVQTKCWYPIKIKLLSMPKNRYYNQYLKSKIDPTGRHFYLNEDWGRGPRSSLMVEMNKMYRFGELS